jgi:hypothetical protein
MVEVIFDDSNPLQVSMKILYNEKLYFEALAYGEINKENDCYYFKNLVLSDYYANIRKEYTSEANCIDGLLYTLGYSGGSMLADDIRDFSRLFTKYLDCSVSSSSWDCECCGVVYDSTIDIDNKCGDIREYTEDGHFGNSRLPIHQDLYELIFKNMEKGDKSD